MLVAVCGPPGVGKTAVSAWIADRLDARLIRTDVVRGEVVENPEYTETERERIYQAVFRRVDRALESRSPVVVDGTFDRRVYRERARGLAAEAGIRFELVRVTCDPPVVERRIAQREDDASDATVENYHEIRERFDPVEAPHLRIDNSGPWETTERSLREHY